MALKRSTKALQSAFKKLHSSIDFGKSVGIRKNRSTVAKRIRDNYKGVPSNHKKSYRKSVANRSLRFL